MMTLAIAWFCLKVSDGNIIVISFFSFAGSPKGLRVGGLPWRSSASSVGCRYRRCTSQHTRVECLARRWIGTHQRCGARPATACPHHRTFAGQHRQQVTQNQRRPKRVDLDHFLECFLFYRAIALGSLRLSYSSSKELVVSLKTHSKRYIQVGG